MNTTFVGINTAQIFTHYAHTIKTKQNDIFPRFQGKINYGKIINGRKLSIYRDESINRPISR